MRISVTHHAVDRAVERFPSLAGIEWSRVRLLIVREVAAALAANRHSRRRPDFAWWSTAVERRKPHGQRFAWTEDESRTFVLDDSNPGHVVVLTTLAQPPWRVKAA